jgi:hydroxyethylthiazole kinase-like uncharacterized protein yjeF
MAAARIGAGAVTVLSPAAAMLVNASHLTAIMLAKVDDTGDLAAFIERRKPDAFVLGPGFGVGEKTRELALAVLENRDCGALVLDADGITSFRDAPASLFIMAGSGHAPPLVLTPHEGEFARLFPGLAEDAALSKLDKARRAADRAHAVVIYKGPDTVIAAPDGRAAINANGTPYLATAGSGDVLSGMTAGLLAQGMPAFEAACAAVWMHADAGSRFGPGLIAEDLPGLLPAVLAGVLRTLKSRICGARRRISSSPLVGEDSSPREAKPSGSANLVRGDDDPRPLIRARPGAGSYEDPADAKRQKRRPGKSGRPGR